MHLDTILEIMTKAIMDNAGLSEWAREDVESEVWNIIQALDDAGFKIERKDNAA